MNKSLKFAIYYGLLVLICSFFASIFGSSLQKPNFGTIVWALAPMVVALSLRIYSKDWSDLGIKPKFRLNGKWYLISIFIFPIAFFVSVFIGEFLGLSQIINFDIIDFFKTASIGIIVFLILAFIEEIGWRGYLVPKLYGAGVSSQWTSVYVGIIWATWHFPYFKDFIGFSDFDFSFYSFPVFILECIALSFVYTEIRLITNSFIPAVFFHAFCNAIGHTFAAKYLNISIGKTFFGTIGYNVILLIIVFLFVGLWLRKYRKTISVHS